MSPGLTTTSKPSHVRGTRKAPRSRKKGHSQGPEVRSVPCDSCGQNEFKHLFGKDSARNERFQLVRCTSCALVQVNPQPNAAAVLPYYDASYFEKRTDRGYDNYFSYELRQSINRTYHLNLRDLQFYPYEAMLFGHKLRPTSLDIGCAAGYFVDYLRSRGWTSGGVELSRAAARFGIEELGLDILIDDFLTSPDLNEEGYDLVSLWASIEHMHSPRRVLERARALLKPGGRMLLSTCRYGVLARMTRSNWRYMNVPEHLYFFSLSGLRDLAADVGFRTIKHVTYGSGFTTRSGAGPVYRTAKRIADPLVKVFDQGDMMAFHLEKVGS